MLLEFAAGQGIQTLQHYPLVATDVRRWNDSLPLREFGKFLRVAFENQPLRDAGNANHREDFAAHLEAEFVFPLQVLSCTGKREAQLADGIEVHDRIESLNHRGIESLKPVQPSAAQ